MKTANRNTVTHTKAPEGAATSTRCRQDLAIASGFALGGVVLTALVTLLGVIGAG